MNKTRFRTCKRCRNLIDGVNIRWQEMMIADDYYGLDGYTFANCKKSPSVRSGMITNGNQSAHRKKVDRCGGCAYIITNKYEMFITTLFKLGIKL